MFGRFSYVGRPRLFLSRINRVNDPLGAPVFKSKPLRTRTVITFYAYIYSPFHPTFPHSNHISLSLSLSLSKFTDMGSCKRNMMYVISILSIILTSTHLSLSVARPLEEKWGGKKEVLMFESLQKGQMPPPGHSGCTYGHENNGGTCKKLEEMNFAVHVPTTTQASNYGTSITLGAASEETSSQDRIQGHNHLG